MQHLIIKIYQKKYIKLNIVNKFMFIFGMSHGPMKELDIQGDSKIVSKTKLLLNRKYLWYLF